MKIFFPLLCAAALNAAPVIQLPENIAWIDGKALSSSKIAAAWKNALSALPDDVSRETLQRIYKSLVDEAVWQHEIAAMLASADIRISRETACRYFEDHYRKYPEFFTDQIKKKYSEAAGSPDVMLKAAIHYYLKKAAPGKINISDEEAEDYYWTHPDEFKVPGKMNLGIIKAATRENAQMARAYLLQGGSFETAVRRFSDPKLPLRIPDEVLHQVRQLKINEVSPVIPGENLWLVFQLRHKSPDTLLPFSKAKPQIMMLLSSRKEGQLLAELLTARLKAQKITSAEPNWNR